MHKPLTAVERNTKRKVLSVPVVQVVCVFVSKLVLKQERMLKILKDNEAISQSLENKDKLKHPGERKGKCTL